MQAEEVAAALDQLDLLLDRETEDFFVSNEQDAASLKTAAARLALQLADAQPDAYELRFGAEARAQLREALQQSDMSRVDWIQFRYAGTLAATEATLISARLLRDQGSPSAAAARLQALSSYPNLTRPLEPEYSLNLAVAWLESGERDLARETLLKLHQSQRPAKVQLGQAWVPWFAQEAEVDSWLAENLLARQNLRKPVMSEFPELHVQWRVETGEFAEEVELLESLESQFLTQGIPVIPVTRPVSSDRWVIARSTRRLFGFDPVGGKRHWLYPAKPEFNLNDPLLVPAKDNRKTLTESGEEVFRHTWTDQLYAGMAADGDRLFLIDQLTSPQPMNNGRFQPLVRQPVRFPLPDPTRCRLVALDLQREGALAWTLGGSVDPENPPPQTESEKALRDAFFLSPPYVHEKTLYVLVEMQQQIKLVALESATGKLQWQQTLLALNNNPVSGDANRRLGAGKIRYVHEQLVCWSGAEYIFGYDLSGRRLAWQHKFAEPTANAKDEVTLIEPYPSTSRYNTYYRDPRANQWADFIKFASPADRWVESTMLCEGRYCLVTPRGLDAVYCLDLFTGEQLWTRRRDDFLYVGCLHDSAALLVGRYRIALVQLRDGKPIWVSIPSSLGKPAGKGTRIENHFIYPTTDQELLIVDLLSGMSQVRSVDYSVGNLTQHGSLLVSQSATEFVAFSWEQPEVPVSYIAASQESRTPGEPEAGQEVSDEQIKQWVAQLGAAEFRVREQAEKQLAEVGMRAQEFLRGGLESTDPEVRIRSRKLMTLVVKQASDRRLEAFRKATKNDDVPLPGWENYKKRIGSNEAARSVFADMFEAEPKLFNMLERDPKGLSQQLNARCTSLRDAMSRYQYQLTFPTIAAVAFLTTHPEVQRDTTIISTVANFCYQNAFRTSIGDADKGDVSKKILIELMLCSDESSNYQLVNLGLQYDIRECYPIARKICESNINGHTKAYALFAIGRYGGKQDLPLIEKLLDDKYQCTSYSTNGKRYITQVRDVALVTLIKMYKKEPKDFGFERIQENGNMVAMHTIGFEDDDERGKTIKKWQEFSSKNPAFPEESPEADEPAPKDAPQGKPAK